METFELHILTSLVPFFMQRRKRVEDYLATFSVETLQSMFHSPSFYVGRSECDGCGKIQIQTGFFFFFGSFFQTPSSCVTKTLQSLDFQVKSVGELERSNDIKFGYYQHYFHYLLISFPKIACSPVIHIL
jgi:hypothetical protein